MKFATILLFMQNDASRNIRSNDQPQTFCEALFPPLPHITSTNPEKYRAIPPQPVQELKNFEDDVKVIQNILKFHKIQVPFEKIRTYLEFFMNCDTTITVLLQEYSDTN